MQSKTIRSLTLALVILLITLSACNLADGAATPATPTLEQAPLIPIAGDLVTPTIPPTEIPATATVVLTHVMTPTEPRGGKVIYDVKSAGTAPEQRAPYGDSYDMNRLERPFMQEMVYIPDLDINSFTVAKDNDWWYVSIELIGEDPNNAMDINYGVELDLDRDGFGDYLIWAHPPYTDQWDTLPVQIFQDQNHNTGGLSSSKSDAPLDGDGYENLIFDGSVGGNDPDMAWVRINAGPEATVQFAFKRSWSGSIFMLGVIADAGLKDPEKLDYVDRFPIADAGSPVKENQNYPLKELVLVDNTCRDAFGFEPTHYEPQACPVPATPTPKPRQPRLESGVPAACQPPVAMQCPNGWDPVNCRCR
ncbi:MAG TPA: hypothetical protein VFQ13_22790 [Anaerolineales bacterium]|nr:hypothetical protein [Anaerolineales bacterium]